VEPGGGGGRVSPMASSMRVKISSSDSSSSSSSSASYSSVLFALTMAMCLCRSGRRRARSWLMIVWREVFWKDCGGEVMSSSSVSGADEEVVEESRVSELEENPASEVMTAMSRSVAASISVAEMAGMITRIGVRYY